MMHRSSSRLAIVLFLAAALIPPPAAAHAEVALDVQDAPAAAMEAVPAGQEARGAAPRTLRAYWHLFAAFALAWILLFGYVLHLGRRFTRVERELAALDASGPD